MANRRAGSDGGSSWAYVSIDGIDYCQAVAVMVAKEGDRLAIREIELGRLQAVSEVRRTIRKKGDIVEFDRTAHEPGV